MSRNLYFAAAYSPLRSHRPPTNTSQTHFASRSAPARITHLSDFTVDARTPAYHAESQMNLAQHVCRRWSNSRLQTDRAEVESSLTAAYSSLRGLTGQGFRLNRTILLQKTGESRPTRTILPATTFTPHPLQGQLESGAPPALFRFLPRPQAPLGPPCHIMCYRARGHEPPSKPFNSQPTQSAA